MSKLHHAIVRFFRKVKGDVPQRVLAKIGNVHQSNVSRSQNRVTWRHVR